MDSEHKIETKAYDDHDSVVIVAVVDVNEQMNETDVFFCL